jgi:lipid II isoglutaminyl synthase (glutamine-hydrolysing)
VRLKYSGVAQDNIIVVQPLDKALQQGLDSLEVGQTLWVLPTYTCLLELQKIVKSMGYSLSGT